jgi:hypothetical protein
MSKVFHPSTAAAISDARLNGIYTMPVRDLSVGEADFDAEIQELVDSIKNALGCVRAVQAAVAIEAAGALLIYAVWFVAHIHR